MPSTFVVEEAWWLVVPQSLVGGKSRHWRLQEKDEIRLKVCMIWSQQEVPFAWLWCRCLPKRFWIFPLVRFVQCAPFSVMIWALLRTAENNRLAPPSTLRSLWVHASFLLLGMGTATSADLTPWRVEFQIQVGENSNFRGPWSPWTGIWGHFRKLKFEFKSQMYLPWILRLGS